eukprot:CAMPEP_0113292786 /NCGR_PEP_ID=MMETSP0008_2-20120614/34875_1 /TAXON_ID=97485 /ORGANISM="Prymnesium parvum" /LENGTH=163 /DNA_ID=CAMNT_0000145003 /DNA_START=1379 /DNA_END=1872 /DNA_ORIENTATION=+ /assembly_acc=CAM_ASM_000153
MRAAHLAGPRRQSPRPPMGNRVVGHNQREATHSLSAKVEEVVVMGDRNDSDGQQAGVQHDGAVFFAEGKVASVRTSARLNVCLGLKSDSIQFEMGESRLPSMSSFTRRYAEPVSTSPCSQMLSALNENHSSLVPKAAIFRLSESTMVAASITHAPSLPSGWKQ